MSSGVRTNKPSDSPTDAAGIVREGRELAAIHPNIVVKVPLIAAGLEAAGAVLIFTLIRFISAPETLADNRWLALARRVTGLEAQEDFLVAFAAAVAGFYLVKNATLILQTYFTAKSAGLSVDSLANRLLRGYLLAPYAHHLTRNSADLIRNTNDVVVSAYRNMLMALVHAASEASLHSRTVVSTEVVAMREPSAATW